MATIGERLREARIKAGYETAREACKAFGWQENTYRGHENGARNPPRDMVMVYASAYRVSVSWLMSGKQEGGGKNAAPGGQHIAILEWSDLQPTRAAMVQVLRKANRGHVTLPEKIGTNETFELPVQDRSMVAPSNDPYSLHPGDKVFVDMGARVAPGKICMIYDPDARSPAFRKAQSMGQGQLRFAPLNPDYHNVDLPADSPHIIGVVIRINRPTA